MGIHHTDLNEQTLRLDNGTRRPKDGSLGSARAIQGHGQTMHQSMESTGRGHPVGDARSGRRLHCSTSVNARSGSSQFRITTTLST